MRSVYLVENKVKTSFFVAFYKLKAKENAKNLQRKAKELAKFGQASDKIRHDVNIFPCLLISFVCF